MSTKTLHINPKRFASEQKSWGEVKWWQSWLRLHSQCLEGKSQLVFMLLAGGAAAIYFNTALHAGCLSGDECCAVNLANMSLANMCHWLLFDSYPILWPLVLKLWMVPFGDGDTSIRAAGLVVQLAILASVWFYGRTLKRFPGCLCSLVLLLPAFVNHTSSGRAWGLGMLTLILAYTFIQRMLINDSDGNTIAAIITSVLAVQTTYYNSVLLFAIVAATLITHWSQRYSLFGIAFWSGISMLPYIGVFRAASEHYRYLHVHFGLMDFVRHLSATATDDGKLGLAIAWLLIGALLVMEHPRYELILIALSIAAYFLFLCKISYITQTWYYLPLICLICMAVDSMPHRLNPLIFIPIFVIQLPAAYSASNELQNGIKYFSQYIDRTASPGDLVILIPWGIEISYQRYQQRQDVTLLTIPSNITNQVVTRYDEEAKYIASHEEPDIDDAKAAIVSSLNNHHRVFAITWNVDWMHSHRLAPTYAQLHAALPNFPKNASYCEVQIEQLVNFIQHTDADVAEVFPVPPAERVSGWTQNTLVVMQPHSMIIQ